ncbi:N-acetyltransferase [Clostridium sp. P21]|uniref:N-acetyltransferase n=2 Tax=Clostridium muellerianum TaxID=2716538 RepID=A0A7Y0HMC6_9CLOT|nr:acyltransferase [Clostridium muellerianum]NMM61487.1 N-acetyltransferase [Clostridium muellerianum]
MNYFVHPTAEVSDRAVVGEDTKVWNDVQIRENAHIGYNCVISKGVYIDFDVIIGNNVKIQNGVNLYHGVTIEDDVFLGPSMTFTNDFYPRAFNSEFEVKKTLVKKGASIGANSTIICGIVIGKYAMIGAGSVVTKNVPDYALVVGNPGKIVGYVCKCGTKLNENFLCDLCKIQYKKDSKNKLIVIDE